MEFPTVINWTSPFHLKGCWVVVFIFIQILREHSVNRGDPDQTPRSVESDLVLHCLPMSNKKEARLYG